MIHIRLDEVIDRGPDGIGCLVDWVFTAHSIPPLRRVKAFEMR
jgi:hypothetical protein